MPDRSFRLVATNLFTRFVDARHFASVLDEVRPNVLVAVELEHKAADVIATRFPHHHLEPDAGYMGWGLAADVPLDVDPGRPRWRRGTSGRLEFDSFTLHLAAVHILDPLRTPLRRTASIRRHQVEALLDWGEALPPDEPQLVVGDLNAGPWWWVYRQLARRWPDLIVAGAPETRPSPTWGLPWGPRLLRIDHVLGSGLVATSSRTVRVKGSDHSAVVVDLRLVPPR